MSVNVTTNFTSFSDALNEVSNKVSSECERLSGKVSFDTLFNEEFMSKYTKFKSLEELLTSGGYGTTEEAFKAIPDDEFDKYICQCTKFSSWKEMQVKAAENYVASNFNL